ncbi:EIF3C [Cordylochernes scorpioides]|uniref:EIF3C n=1 Tax=Cordylochernes scorpioides TaxID=51811 RepID=A0ABY6L396_9ARAC|nr:EIF3C [Cordylochernes scorpioides]
MPAARCVPRCMQSLGDILELLENNTTIQVGEHVAEECEALIVPPYKVRGCILTVVERMDEEFCKILQGCDAHSPEYVERLKDETQVCNIILRLEKYLEEKGQPSEICRIYLRHIDHIYYKYDRNGVDTSLDTMARLAKYIYAKDTTDRIRTQAILFHIFHQALHDNLNEARNLMLMSHLQDSIHFADVPTQVSHLTCLQGIDKILPKRDSLLVSLDHVNELKRECFFVQILFNRAVVQIGLCCFRHGEIKEAHTALLDIQTGGRAKELLAQGLLPQRQHERTSEQEKIEKRRQIPFHKHINLELLECVYLVSAMLLEIPYMAAHEMDGRKRMISKSYHHQLRNSERQPLVGKFQLTSTTLTNSPTKFLCVRKNRCLCNFVSVGPPESMREHVVAASKAMRVGNWRACKNYIINDKMNAKVWDLFPQNKMKVTQMITEKIKEGSLRTYLFTYSQVYDSLSIPLLASMFDMPSKSVYSIVSKMMISEDLMASLDEPTQAIVMHRTEPTRIQALALQLADKVNSLTEQNDKLSEMKSGNFFGRNAGKL